MEARVPREALMDSIRRVQAGETSVPVHLVAKLADRVRAETFADVPAVERASLARPW